MKAWPHILNLLLIVLIVLMFMGVINIHMTTKVAGTTPPVNAEAYVAIDAAGNLTFVDKNGKQAPQCGIGADSAHPPCEGLGGAKGVTQTIKTIGIMTVKGSACYGVISGDGTISQICY